jgi:hypothetical protein
MRFQLWNTLPGTCSVIYVFSTALFAESISMEPTLRNTRESIVRWFSIPSSAGPILSALRNVYLKVYHYTKSVTKFRLQNQNHAEMPIAQT